jgi:hypothetical protein
MTRNHLRSILLAAYVLIGLGAAAVHAYLLAGVFLGATPIILLQPLFVEWRTRRNSGQTPPPILRPQFVRRLTIALWIFAIACFTYVAVMRAIYWGGSRDFYSAAV